MKGILLLYIEYYERNAEGNRKSYWLLNKPLVPHTGNGTAKLKEVCKTLQKREDEIW